MTGRRLLIQCTIAAAAFVGAMAMPATAQETHSRGYNAIFENLDAILEAYTRMLVRKYDLTDEQAQVTREMLEGKAREFLDNHEPEIREAVDRMFDVRLGAEMSQEDLMEWGRRVTPLYSEAKKIIVDGNNQFRELLTDDQRKIHDEDLKLMNQSFATTEQQLGKIIDGEMTVQEFRNGGRPTPQQPPRPPVAAGVSPDTPPVGRPPTDYAGRARPAVQVPPSGAVEDGSDLAANPSGETVTTVGADGNVVTTSPNGEVVNAQPAVVHPGAAPGAVVTPPNAPQPVIVPAKAANRQYESEWEKYTREFISRYNLNDDQTAKANATLKDCQDQAARVMRTRDPQIEDLEKQIGELKATPPDKEKAAKIADMEKQKVKLLEPIGDIFERKLKPRLETLPTRAQRKAAEEAAKPAPSKTAPKPEEKKREKK